MKRIFWGVFDEISARRKVRKFQKALENADIDGVIEYVKRGGDLNVVMTVDEYCEGFAHETEKTPVEIASETCEVIAVFLKKHGALTLSELKKQEAEEKNNYALKKIEAYESNDKASEETEPLNKVLKFFGYYRSKRRFFRAVRTANWQYIHQYIQAGGNVNVVSTEYIYEHAVDDFSTRFVTPYDVADNDQVRSFLRENGGMSWRELYYQISTRTK